MAKISVLGAGGWGIALALLANDCSHEVCLWTHSAKQKDELNQNRTDDKLLFGVKIPENIEITDDINRAENSDITIIAVPSFAVSEVAVKLSAVKNHGITVNVAKGFETNSLRRLSEVLTDLLPQDKLAVLSGPSHAEEVSRKIPTSVVVASKDEATAKKVQELLSNEYFRIYTSLDLIGVELGGALKNVIAVCAGICDGLGLGDNSKAALITRGLAEMTRLGCRMGAEDKTFAGLSGIGDLVVTCTSLHSRNNRFGNLVGSGVSVENALFEVGTVEGYYAVNAAHKLAEKYDVQLPIVNTCYEILYCGRRADTAVKELMSRPTRAE